MGSSEQTLEETTLAYSIFPGGGERPERTHIIDKIEDSDGALIYQRESRRKRVISDASAWQVHSLLSDTLNRGTGSKAVTDYGLAVAGAAGKPGTAYNFTDVWFLGYSQAITCGVWIGYDQPKQIFRGAFGGDLALPVWVDVMNASRNDFPSSPIKRPLTVEPVDICRLSGEVATEKCMEKVRAPNSADSTETTVYTEYARIGNSPKIQCSVHAGGLRNFVKEFAEEEWPRAAVAVDLSKIRPVDVSASPVVGAADPYNAVSPSVMSEFGGDVPVAQAVAVNLPVTPEGGAPDSAVPLQPEVRKAEPAGVGAVMQTERPNMGIPPPPPIRF